MQRIVSSHRRFTILWPLCVPLGLVPCALSLASTLLLAWSCAVLLFTVWRITQKFATSQINSQHDCPDTRRIIRRFAWATAGIQLLPALWIAGLWALQAATRPLLSFDVTHIAFADLLFWLVLFGFVCGLFRISRTLFSCHRIAAQSACRAFLRWILHSPGAAELLFEEVSHDID